MAFPTGAHADFIGKVVGVMDGDSIRVMHEGQAEQIRLLGIDCPEKRQPFGTRAKEYTSELAFGQEVRVYGDKRDRYGRRLAEVLLPDGRSLNQELIKAGLRGGFGSIRKMWDWALSNRRPGLREGGSVQSPIRCHPGSGGSTDPPTDNEGPYLFGLLPRVARETVRPSLRFPLSFAPTGSTFPPLPFDTLATTSSQAPGPNGSETND